MVTYKGVIIARENERPTYEGWYSENWIRQYPIKSFTTKLSEEAKENMVSRGLTEW